MNEISVYTVERNASSGARRCDVHFRLTYEREFLPAQNLWRDFLVHCEETGLATRDASTENPGGGAARQDARPDQVHGAENCAAASAARFRRVA